MATDEMTVKPKGGRGKRADYTTVQVRCPEPIKEAVVNLINQWHLGEVQPSESVTELTELKTEIEALKQVNQNLNTTIEELRKRNEELEAILEVNTLKAELNGCNQNLNTSIEEREPLNLNTSNSVTQKLNLNTGINPKALEILEQSLSLKSNAGGKIKEAIRQALTLLK
ncbi:MAG: hypothetical protein ACKPEN_07890 [Planktothrix sp.]|uniref:hypothetical protein n=2 Tax=Planktothrix sp. TaxID=3088171 RepID=UPI0038D3C678